MIVLLYKASFLFFGIFMPIAFILLLVDRMKRTPRGSAPLSHNPNPRTAAEVTRLSRIKMLFGAVTAAFFLTIFLEKAVIVPSQSVNVEGASGTGVSSPIAPQQIATQAVAATPAPLKAAAENSIEATVKGALKSVSEVSADGPAGNRQISVRFMSRDAVTVSGDMELIALDMQSALRAIKEGGHLRGNATGRVIFFVEARASGPEGKGLAYKVWYPATAVETARLGEMNWKRIWEISDDVDVRPMMREMARDFCSNRDNKRQTGKLCEGR